MAESTLKLALVSEFAVDDVLGWSGIPYHLNAAFGQCEGLLVNPVIPERPELSSWLKLQLRFQQSRTPQLKIWEHYEPLFLKKTAQSAQSKLQDQDAVFSIFPDAWVESDRDLPWFFFSDATFACLRRLYPSLHNLHPRTVANGERFWQKAVQRATGMIFSCNWAADSAIKDYGADPQKIAVLPMGANLQQIPTREEVESYIAQRSQDQLELLWIGVDWERKGGDEAIALAAELIRRGYRVILHIVGTIPPMSVPSYIRCHGFLRKSVPTESAKLGELLRQSHFFVLPTRAECSAIVLPEANAYGLPAITNDVGGTSTVVHHYVNGCLVKGLRFDYEAANYIESIYVDQKTYHGACLQAWDDQARRLNWHAFTANALQFMRERLER